MHSYKLELHLLRATLHRDDVFEVLDPKAFEIGEDVVYGKRGCGYGYGRGFVCHVNGLLFIAL